MAACPRKPARHAYERDGGKVKEWLEDACPEIKRRARREKADVYQGDETTAKARGDAATRRGGRRRWTGRRKEEA
ncbi:MAG: hypothetical protein LBD58_00675 [Treponema sp.]|nr:hypothetical protein [Treponema sp.]